MSSLLETCDLRAGYQGADVLRGVDLTVPPGCTVALLGANGAGKTTLLKTLAGLVPATGGQIRLRGRDVTSVSPHARARDGLCLIPEGRGVFRRLTVRENLVVHAGPKGRDNLERAATVFPVLGRRAGQQAGTLSGGEQQMLALARAFLTGSDLILADELSMGLAPLIVDQIFEALGTLRQEGRSILLVEQYVERAVDFADYVYILHKGNVVFRGQAAECTSGEVFTQYLGGAA